MATPTCVRCEAHAFEMVPFVPLGADYKLQMIQCAACGAPVTALDPSVSAAIVRIATAVSEIDEGLRRIALALVA